MHQRLQIDSKNKSNILYISKTIIDSSFTPSVHSHQNLEILYIIKGKGKVYTDSNVLQVKQDDLVIINKNTTHFEETIGLEFYALGINGLEIGLKNNLSANIFVLNSNNKLINIKNAYDNIFEEASKKDEFSSVLIDSYTNIIISILKRNSSIDFNLPKKLDHTPLIALCIQLIKSNYSSNITIEELAKRLNVSASHLSHQFKSETGLSIFEYKLNCQIEEAKSLLNITDMSISQIASLVGFNSISFFGKKFKEVTMMSPSDYRLFKDVK